MKRRGWELRHQRVRSCKGFLVVCWGWKSSAFGHARLSLLKIFQEGIKETFFLERLNEEGSERMRAGQKRPRIRDKYTWDDKENVIGEGTYGIVYKASPKTHSSSKCVAIKKFKNTKEGEGISLTACREITVCSLCCCFHHGPIFLKISNNQAVAWTSASKRGGLGRHISLRSREIPLYGVWVRRIWPICKSVLGGFSFYFVFSLLLLNSGDHQISPRK